MISRIDTETGQECSKLRSAYTTALRVADNALLFKYLVKSLGIEIRHHASFMAKPWGNVGLSFLASFLISYQLWLFGQLPGCSGYVQNWLVSPMLTD